MSVEIYLVFFLNMKSVNKKSIIWSFVVIVAVIFIIWAVWPSIKESKVKAENEAEIQALRETPAAEYCQNNWWILQIKTDELAGVYWMCNFKDGSACEILEYFRWECLSASEQEENDEDLYCSDSSACEDEEAEDLSSWIENINNMGDIDEEIIEGDDLDEIDIDSLYDYYENEFSSTWNKNIEQSIWEFNWEENEENQLLSACNKVWWEILGEKCYLSNWIEIAF